MSATGEAAYAHMVRIRNTVWREPRRALTCGRSRYVNASTPPCRGLSVQGSASPRSRTRLPRGEPRGKPSRLRSRRAAYGTTPSAHRLEAHADLTRECRLRQPKTSQPRLSLTCHQQPPSVPNDAAPPRQPLPTIGIVSSRSSLSAAPALTRNTAPSSATTQRPPKPPRLVMMHPRTRPKTRTHRHTSKTNTKPIRAAPSDQTRQTTPYHISAKNAQARR